MDFVNTFLATLVIPKNLAGDLSLVLVFLGVSLALGFILGRWKLVNFLIDIYVVVAILSVLPAELFAFSPYARVGAFAILLAFLVMVDSRLLDVHITSAGTDFFWRLFVMSILVTGMLVSVTLVYLPKTLALSLISTTAYSYFASPIALVVWMVLPLVSLLFINNRLK